MSYNQGHSMCQICDMRCDEMRKPIFAHASIQGCTKLAVRLATGGLLQAGAACPLPLSVSRKLSLGSEARSRVLCSAAVALQGHVQGWALRHRLPPHKRGCLHQSPKLPLQLPQPPRQWQQTSMWPM